MITGAVLEPKALCGSTSVTPDAAWGAADAKRTAKAPSKPKRRDAAKVRRRFTRSSECFERLTLASNEREFYLETIQMREQWLFPGYARTERDIPQTGL